MSEASCAEPALTGSFSDLSLSEPILQALRDVGYESPSPIQAAIIPEMLAGRDVVGQAQTGTGKTAAFALPILTGLDIERGNPQTLVLAPTRELAIQVAEAFQRYAAHLPGFHVLPIYGGQSYGPQLAGLRRGVHVVVGTPGRLIDHIKRGSLDLSTLRCIVLDEADEMLRMGFIEDVEWILSKTPGQRQVALFSATMPAQIRRIAKAYLKSPAEITIQGEVTTAPDIRQRYWWVSGLHKLDALTRILEAEPFDAMIVFTRTKLATEELATRLEARGFAAAAINGDMAQPLREKTIDHLRSGKIDILVATDVAARGLDVERVSHIVNYDVPHDTESYVHRVGRTGRAGRKGDAILFVTPRERGMLYAIERATRQPIEQMSLPTVAQVNDQRIARFMQRICDTLAADGLDEFRTLIERVEQSQDTPARDIAAALAKIVHGDAPLLLDAKDPPPISPPPPGRNRDKSARRSAGGHAARKPEVGKETFRIEIGHAHGVKPGNIVGAIANEAGLDAAHIGRIDIRNDHTLVDLPEGMPRDILRHLKKVRVCSQLLQIRRTVASELESNSPDTRHKPKSSQSPKHSSAKGSGRKSKPR
jgi:ATP-dependent RNA helicase DeaD